jgi:hypothetical protein
MANDRVAATLEEIRQELRLIRTKTAEINRMLDKRPTKRQCWLIVVGLPLALLPLLYLFVRFLPVQ